MSYRLIIACLAGPGYYESGQLSANTFNLGFPYCGLWSEWLCGARLQFVEGHDCIGIETYDWLFKCLDECSSWRISRRTSTSNIWPSSSFGYFLLPVTTCYSMRRNAAYSILTICSCPVIMSLQAVLCCLKECDKSESRPHWCKQKRTKSLDQPQTLCI